MTDTQDPTEALRKKAAAFPAVTEGMSCNQTSFKTGKGTFLYVGPGSKGKGFKAMFKLGASLLQAKELADEEPHHFEVGSNGWVSTRFSMERPLPSTIWQKWLQESYDLTCHSGVSQKST